ncbi:MAG: hypothetical protein RR066_00605 [Mucinivorans sp.]
MKRTILKNLALLLTVPTLFACTKFEQVESPVTGKYSINVSVERQEDDGQDSPSSRTALQQHDIVWSSGDKIMVVHSDKAQSAEYTLSSAPGSTKGTFTSNTPLEPGGVPYALYPYNQAATYSSNNTTFNFTLPKEQTYVNGTFGPGANPMVARSNPNSSNLTFKNLCGVIKFQLVGTETVDHIDLTTAGESIAGGATVDMSYGQNPTLILTKGSGQTKITLTNINVELSTTTATAFYFVVPAGEYAAGLKFTAYNKQGTEIASKQTTKALTIKRNYICNLNPTRLFYFPDAAFRDKTLQYLASTASVTIYRLPNNNDIDVTDPRNKPFLEAMQNLILNSTSGIPGVTEIKTLKGIEYFSQLKSLSCVNLQLTELDVSHNTLLERLICLGNQLTELDLSKNTVLANLNCAQNSLSVLKLSANTNLLEMSCYDNMLNSLDLSNYIKLEKLLCYSNRLLKLDISSLPNLRYADVGSHTVDGTAPQTLTLRLTQEQSGVTNIANTHERPLLNQNITNEKCYFPDFQFRLLLVNRYGLKAYNQEDLDPNDPTNKQKFNEITDLNLDYVPSGETRIKTLTGIEFFTNLTRLSCKDNQITHLNASQNKKLTHLDCSGNQLMGLNGLDVSGCVNLQELRCNNNGLLKLDVKSNVALQLLSCHHNKISSSTNLDLTKNSALTTLSCSNNGMSELILSGNPNLKLLNVDVNNLQTLNLINQAQLTDFHCRDNKLIRLDNIGHMTNLQVLNCTGNRSLASLVVGSNTTLETLNCDSCALTTLDISNLLTSLKSLNCSSNKLRTLTLDNSQIVDYPLTTLNCSHNLLTTINFDNCIHLQTVDCSFNEIKDGNLIIMHGELKSFFCDENFITKLTLHTDKLTSLHCGWQRQGGDLTLLIPLKATLDALIAKGEFKLDVNKHVVIKQL